MGIYPSQPNKKPLLNISTIFLFGNAQFMLPMVAYLKYEAKEMFDYGMVFFIATSTITGVVDYLLLIWQYESTMKFIETCEKFIEKRK